MALLKPLTVLVLCWFGSKLSRQAGSHPRGLAGLLSLVLGNREINATGISRYISLVLWMEEWLLLDVQ